MPRDWGRDSWTCRARIQPAAGAFPTAATLFADAIPETPRFSPLWPGVADCGAELRRFNRDGSRHLG